MAGSTDRFGLTTLGAGDSLQQDGFKFTDADRRLIDRLLTYAVEEHRHTGASVVIETPPTAPILNGAATGGLIPAGQRYYYRFTIVGADGSESVPSPISFIDMPPVVASPQAPATNFTTGSGSLEPGTYSYVLSAYTGASTLETKAINSAAVTVPGSNPANEVILILPALPPGADGFNIYRKSPSAPYYFHLANVAPAASLSEWIDDGTVAINCERSLPRANTTHNTNLVTVGLPAPPAELETYAWRIYRTTDPNQWTRSLLGEVVPAGDPPVTPDSFTDIGGPTSPGGPPTQVQTFSAPPKVELSDAAEIEGTLPPGRVTFPYQLTFADAGLVAAGEGAFVWVCPFDQARIESVRAYLGIGKAPAEQPVVIDVRLWRNNLATPEWSSVFDPTDRPFIDVGQMVGDEVYLTSPVMELGDMLSIDVLQAGGGATPTDENLSINLLMYVKHGPDDATPF